MRAHNAMAAYLLSFCVLGFISLPTSLINAQPIAQGLSSTYYEASCPNVENIIRRDLRKVFRNNIGLAAGLLRVHFHDCFVHGCDGSLLLDGSASEPSEKNAPPNLNLQPEAFNIINDLRNRVHRACGPIVSCSDILTLVARDSVFFCGGPDYPVPLGRRDALNYATRQETVANLPVPSANVTTLINLLATKNLNVIDLVALSGSHTIGLAHCPSFDRRLYPTQDPTMDRAYARHLRVICPALNVTNITTVLDIRTPNLFDNKYYLDLMYRQGLFTSDQDLYTDRRTRPIVTEFALDQALFFEQFAIAMNNMGRIQVLTGRQGEIRTNCSAPNSDRLSESLGSLPDEQNGKAVSA